jgi:hypothetical protein
MAEPSLDPDDQETMRLVRRRQGRRLALAVLVPAAAIPIAIEVSRSPSLNEVTVTPTPWMQIAGPVLLLAGVVLVLAGVVSVFRRGGFRSPLWALTSAQRRRLRTQVMRNAVDPDADPAAVRLLATAMVDNLAQMWVALGTSAFLTGDAFIRMTRLSVITACAIAAVAGASALLRIRDAVRADRFLTDHAL